MPIMRQGAAIFLALSDDALLRQCAIDCYRASGPGGQKRNKTSSAVRLRHTPTGLMATASEERSQHLNKARALRRLRATIALEIRKDGTLVGLPPSALLRSYLTAAGAIKVAVRNEHYWHVVAEVLDVVESCHSGVRDAAQRLGVTTAHLVKFLAGHPKVWERVNQMRAAAGAKPLRAS